jgi:hypothetical protein
MLMNCKALVPVVFDFSPLKIKLLMDNRKRMGLIDSGLKPTVLSPLSLAHCP